MDYEEKILALLTQMQTDISGLQTGQAQMQTDISGIKGEISGLKEDISDLRQTITRVALTQENVVLKSLDALVEGQDLTHQRLKDLAGKDELSDLRDEVRLLRKVVVQHSKDIEALKAAR